MEGVVSEQVMRAVQAVAERVSATVGQPSRPDLPERFRMDGVTPDEVAGRLLLGTLDVEHHEALMRHLDRRVELLLSTWEWADEAMFLRVGASVMMSELQCVLLGMHLAAELKNSGVEVAEEELRAFREDVDRIARRTPLEESGPGGPAFESAARSYRPVHGGRPAPPACEADVDHPERGRR
jgi:hypothetical protein